MEKEFIKEIQHSVTLNVTAGRIDSFRIDRYKSYNSGIGADILSGNATLESLEKYALERGEVVDVVESGRQEYLENVLNAVMFD